MEENDVKLHVVDLGKLFRIWRVVILLIPNLTRCEKVDTKSDKTKKILFQVTLFTKTFSFKIMLLRKLFFQNRAL